ncbi:Tail-specific protease precursor [Pseudobythopirellula maris]|uniref:Tail-specific protease n=1 Tax=Pseudobythopirellula maris TaxID=2527991 RepID=A0A5C5ZHL7_9BACT|nr:carboxy terminal-processing peptidase [Pseudobythopirellula maris]TWT86852.1 Tail-specific protease precursor [Pseudobythopirellula maris]
MKYAASDTPSPSRQSPRIALLACVAALFGAALFSTAPLAARPTEPSASDRQIAMTVRYFMERQHLSRHPIDDEISQRGLDAFLKTLDPWKLYFYQSDVDEFMTQRNQLDDLFRRGDIRFAYTVFSRFLARVDERVATATEWVDRPHDFTVDEEMIRDRDEAHYPKSPEEADDRWRKRVKFDLLTQIADKSEIDEVRENGIDPEVLTEARDKIRKRYNSLRKRWDQTSDDELMELYLTSITSGFDPHSSYMSPSTLENFNIQMRLELDGIGASLRGVDGYTEVADVIAGGAADEHGKLKKGDQIIGVGQGTGGELTDIVDMKLNDVVKLIRGKRGTTVRLEVKPVDNPKEIKVYTITRDRIELKNQEARSTVIEWGAKPSGQPYKLGVIHLPSFYMDMDGARAGLPDFRSTTRDVRRLLEGFNRDGVDAVVIDLRFNGGGSLTESVNMTGLFIDRGPVVQVKGTDGRTQPYDDPEPGMVWSGPLAVLTNKFSASASEIFAGAIQDYGRGIVIGDESTHGKGTVQQLYDLGDRLFGLANRPSMGALKMTIQQFYRPGGDSTQNRGVLADVTVPSITDHLDGIAESDMDFAMAFDRVRPLRHDRFAMMTPELGAELQRMSMERIAASEDFAEDTTRIRRYEEQKDDKTVTLNLIEYLTEREELDVDKEQEEIGEKLSDTDKPVYDMDEHYNQEALSIVVDYLKLLKENKVAVAR